jgi:DNA-binding LacI/PurR family transcriptional regulator/DNA-binding transcriptional regulator YhcF (GntR family)
MSGEATSLTTPTLKRSTLSRQIVTALRKEIIDNFKPKQKLPSISHFAKQFGVSYQTVRGGLGVLAAEGLLESHMGSGTYRSDLSKGRHIAVWCEYDIFDGRFSYFYRTVPQRLVRFFQGQGVAARLYVGYRPVGEPLHGGEPTCTEFVDALQHNQLCGVLSFDGSPGGSWLEMLRQQGIPILGNNDQSEYPYVHHRVAKEEEGRLGADWLLRQGCRRIALMHWRGLRGGDSPERDLILKGFRAALTAAGVPIYPHWIRNDLFPSAPGAGWEEFREIWSSSQEKPDGLLVCDDVLFTGAAMAILKLGLRIPEDLRVVTHYHRGSDLILPFPTARLQFDPNDFVVSIGQKLLQMMGGEPLKDPCLSFPCQLMDVDTAIASSSASAPAKKIPQPVNSA